MPKITNSSDDVYQSTDPWNDNQPISIEPGDSADVSAEKAEQVHRDFPDVFKKPRAAKKAKS